jgi:hypothetical protein
MVQTIYNFRVVFTMDIILNGNTSEVDRGDLAPLDTGVQQYA